MSKGYAIYLGKDNRKLKVLEFTIQQYPKSQQLMQFMNEHQNSTITGADLKAAGFEDITKDLMYPTRPMGKSGRGSLADDAQIVLNDNGIQTILQRILSYNNYKASEKIDKNRLVSIEYNEQWYKSTVERIEKCIQHFYQLADDLWSAFADVPGISFEIGEEEAQYANLYFRVLYKGRFFIQLLGKFGGATFLHIISSKQRFPQWEITVHPFEETCQLHGTFKDVHVDKATNEKVLEKVTSSYNGRFEQYSEVQKQFKDIFNTDLDESDFYKLTGSADEIGKPINIYVDTREPQTMRLKYDPDPQPAYFVLIFVIIGLIPIVLGTNLLIRFNREYQKNIR